VLRLDAEVKERKLRRWSVKMQNEDKPMAGSSQPSSEAGLALLKDFEFKVPLAWLMAAPVVSDKGAGSSASPIATRLRLRFSLWSNGLPVDALPVEGWMELQLLSEEELRALG
jgi:hypothetical protein